MIVICAHARGYVLQFYISFGLSGRKWPILIRSAQFIDMAYGLSSPARNQLELWVEGLELLCRQEILDRCPSGEKNDKKQFEIVISMVIMNYTM